VPGIGDSYDSVQNTRLGRRNMRGWCEARPARRLPRTSAPGYWRGTGQYSILFREERFNFKYFAEQEDNGHKHCLEEAMANQGNLAIQKQGVDTWNKRRQQYLSEILDLSDADLRDTDVSRADLRGANLRMANLSAANVGLASLTGSTASARCNLPGLMIAKRKSIAPQTGIKRCRSAVGILCLAVCVALPTAVRSEKLQVAEIVSKHLESIGSAKTRLAATNRLIEGSAHLTYRLGITGQALGTSRLAFQGHRILIAMLFGLANYPHEQLAYDGRDLLVGQLEPGIRSQLCQFLYQHDLLSRQGLLGGVLSAGWALLDPGFRGGRLQLVGSKMVDGLKVHELRYLSQKDRDLEIRLFFEDGTFRHIRSRYSIDIPAPMPARTFTPGEDPDTRNSSRRLRQQLIEDFSNFRAEGALMLPHSYKIQLKLSGTKAADFEWVLTLQEFNLKAALTDADFRLR
jgi:hypothetical protein